MPFRSTKHYDHNLGLSAVFRQHKANSHCNLLHGYPLAFSIVFEATHLDERNWVIDFGALKPIKAKLEDMFDHKLVVATDDPMAKELSHLHSLGLADVRLVDAVGCEAFAKMVFDIVNQWLGIHGHSPRVKVVSVECREHAANSAIYLNPA